MNAADAVGNPIGGPTAREVTCRIEEDSGRIQATIDEPGASRPPQRVELAKASDVEDAAGAHRFAVRSAILDGSMALLATATERVLAEIYDLIAAPLLGILEAAPRVALDLRSGVVAELPVETAHRFTEPALFEVTQVYRRLPSTDEPRAPALDQPRRFRLSIHPGAMTSLDVIALEHSLVHWVSVHNSRPFAGPRPEPLVHIAGHDPAVPEGLLDRTDRAHVVLSGCSSLPRRLPVGVASAVGSLWPVDDQSNSSIMAAYHARLAAGIGPVEALRQAQLLHRHLPPAAWAAYVHVGQPV